MAAKAVKMSIAALILGGLFLFGAGMWIPAKAVVAQHLLHRALQSSSGLTVKP